jgi:hypothetical protein
VVLVLVLELACGIKNGEQDMRFQSITDDGD